MSLHKLAAVPTVPSFANATFLLRRRTPYHLRPISLRSPAYKRAFTLSRTLREQQLSNSSDPQRSSSSPPPTAPTTPSQSTSDKSAKSPDENARTVKHGNESSSSSTSKSAQTHSEGHAILPPGWEDETDYNITRFSELPHRFFGHNQHIRVNEDFKEALRQVLWQFKAPIRYAFAYGSGVFAQKSSSADPSGMSPHPNPPEAVEQWQKGGAKVIDFIFGVSHTQHWHSLNLTQHPDHYSGLKYIPNSSAVVSHIQDDWGAGMYFNPFITVNGIMIKYGVVNLDTLARDLSEWDTLYLAGRLQKPVKILRDDPRIRLANQVNLISALRTALLMLPEKFTERQLYERIAGLSYLGDPRMNSMLASESPNKVANIVGAQLPGFRQLYVPLIENLPNVDFTDSRTPKDHAWEKEDAIRHTGTASKLENVLGGEEGLTLSQDMDPFKRGNMVRRLPKAFRNKVYFEYQREFGITGSEYDEILNQTQDDDPTGFKRREGGDFERRIAETTNLPDVMARCVRNTVAWPSTVQTVKGVFTSGIGKSWKYVMEKRAKGRQRKSTASKPDANQESSSSSSTESKTEKKKEE